MEAESQELINEISSCSLFLEEYIKKERRRLESYAKSSKAEDSIIDNWNWNLQRLSFILKILKNPFCYRFLLAGHEVKRMFDADSQMSGVLIHAQFAEGENNGNLSINLTEK